LERFAARLQVGSWSPRNWAMENSPLP
jgi:hypothetical protein